MLKISCGLLVAGLMFSANSALAQNETTPANVTLPAAAPAQAPVAAPTPTPAAEPARTSAAPAITPSQRMTNDGVLITKKPETIYEESSAYNRIGKKFQLTAQLAGFTVAPVAGAGVNAGAFIDRNSLVQFEYSNGESDNFGSSDFEATVFGAHYKRFYGNSFYVNAGADYRKIKMSTDDDWIFGNHKNEHVGTSEYITGSVAIGNQWQWDNFTMGCDWIGIGLPVAKLNEDYNDKSLDADDRKYAKEDWDDVATATSTQLLRFYIGASF